MEFPLSFKRYLDQDRMIFTDSRHVIPGGVFVALHGKSFDGNNYALEALDKGAAYAIVDKAVKEDPRLILVQDTFQELQKMGHLNRKLNKAKVIAITGSNGKTTTKELTLSIFQLGTECIATHGNLNNHIGVPLSLLRITNATEFAIIEMGANKPGDIKELSEIADPDLAHITNIGKAHLEGMGSIEGVIKTKTELYRYVKSKGKGNCLYNLFSEQMKRLYLNEPGDLSFGNRDSGANFTGELIHSKPDIELFFNNGKEDITLNSSLFGEYNFQNIMSAASIASVCEIPLPLIKEGIGRYIPVNMRSQILQFKGNTILLDAYNANPNSMKEVLEIFNSMDYGKKWVILGEMAELGTFAAQEHYDLVHKASSMPFDKIILIGQLYETYKDDRAVLVFNQLDLAKEWLYNNWPQNTSILIKGSRSSNLEKLIH